MKRRPSYILMNMYAIAPQKPKMHSFMKFKSSGILSMMIKSRMRYTVWTTSIWPILSNCFMRSKIMRQRSLKSLNVASAIYFTVPKIYFPISRNICPTSTNKPKTTCKIENKDFPTWSMIEPSDFAVSTKISRISIIFILIVWCLLL